MELYNGRPKDTTGMLEREIRTYDYLDALGIPYQRTDHEAAGTMEACQELACSRQNISHMLKQGKLKPVKENVRGNLYLKADVTANTW